MRREWCNLQFCRTLITVGLAQCRKLGACFICLETWFNAVSCSKRNFRTLVSIVCARAACTGLLTHTCPCQLELTRSHAHIKQLLLSRDIAQFRHSLSTRSLDRRWEEQDVSMHPTPRHERRYTRQSVVQCTVLITCLANENSTNKQNKQQQQYTVLWFSRTF